MTTKPATVGQSLSVIWAQAEESAKQSLEKIQLLKDFKTTHNMTIIQYSNGILISTLQKVCKAIENISEFDTFEYTEIHAGHGRNFVLCRNQTSSHATMEKNEKESSGQIHDIGEIRIALVFGNTVEKAADFSIYQVPENLVFKNS